MGLKFKRFRAKLKQKQKNTVADVICLRYQTISEELPLQWISLDANLNNVQEDRQLSTKNESYGPTATTHKANEVSSEHNQKNMKTPSNMAKITTPTLQPKSILKKTNDSLDFEELRISPLNVMTEKSDAEECAHSNSHSSPVIQEDHVQLRSQADNTNDFSKLTQNQSDGEDDSNVYYGNGVSYSTQAASIFFDSGINNEQHMKASKL